MKVFVFNFKSLIRYFIGLLIIAGALVAIKNYTFIDISAVNTTATQRELPIYSVDCTEKKAALTFDCAWGADDIPDILEVLNKERIKATFFIVGQWAEKYPEAVKMIADNGHDVANHSYSHLRMGGIDHAKIKTEISVCGNKLSQIAGRKVELFRAPYGDYNDRVVKSARELGYYTIQWDVDSHT